MIPKLRTDTHNRIPANNQSGSFIFFSSVRNFSSSNDEAGIFRIITLCKTLEALLLSSKSNHPQSAVHLSRKPPEGSGPILKEKTPYGEFSYYFLIELKLLIKHVVIDPAQCVVQLVLR